MQRNCEGARASVVAREESLRSELASVQRAILQARAHLAAIPGLEPGEDVSVKLSLVESTMEEDAARVAELAAQKALYGAFADRADTVCLVCDRPFDRPEEALQFGDRLRDKLRAAEANLGPAKKEREESEQYVSVLKPAVAIQV